MIQPRRFAPNKKKLWRHSRLAVEPTTQKEFKFSLKKNSRNCMVFIYLYMRNTNNIMRKKYQIKKWKDCTHDNSPSTVITSCLQANLAHHLRGRFQKSFEVKTCSFHYTQRRCCVRWKNHMNHMKEQMVSFQPHGIVVPKCAMIDAWRKMEVLHKRIKNRSISHVCIYSGT